LKRNKYNTLIDLGGLVGAATVIYLVLKGLGYLGWDTFTYSLRGYSFKGKALKGSL